MRTILIALILSWSLAASAQKADSNHTEKSVDQSAVYTITEQMPEFPGDLNHYLREKLFYPQEARDSNIQGQVVVRFIVDEKGQITSPEVVRSAGSALDKEALRVIRAMPAWKPAKHNGTPVKCYFNLPITFRLQ